MAPPSIGSSRSRPTFRVENFALPMWVHSEVTYWIDEWKMIRDMCEGERAVKDAGKYYLPQLEGMDNKDYSAYLQRATFYPFTGRTASALSGSIFRRRETFTGLPERLKPKLQNITRDNQNFLTFCTVSAEEIIKLGRFAVLLDLPVAPSTEPKPYLVGYTAENILDWEYGEIDGRMELIRIVFQEARLIIDPKSFAKSYQPQYRQLRLTSTGPDRQYVQELYFSADPNKPAVLTEQFRVSSTTPENRGKPLNYIPCHLFGSFESSQKVDKPPMQDIARLNVSHYQSYAYLEHGRFFVGFPIYYVEAPMGSTEDDGEFTIGASKVWITPAGAKPGILELNGQGLKFLVDALDQKEQQAAALGGRMMGVRGTAVSESDNMLKISERNEQSVLLKITRSLDAGYTKVMRWWLTMHDVPKEEADKLEVEFNKDFLFDGIGAREFRAIHSMYKDGVIPIDIVFIYLKKATVIPDWMSIEEFKKLLDKMDSFPNNADIDARREGFADAKSRDQADMQEDLFEHEDGTLDTEQEFEEVQGEKERKSAEKQAKSAPKVTPTGAKPVAKKPVPK